MHYSFAYFIYVHVPPIYKFFSAPSAGVQELNGVNFSSTSLSISWMPPPQDDLNGIIRTYIISYGLTTQSRTEYVDVSTPELMIELTSLEKFAVYEVVVSPYTIAIGPEESVTVRTDSECELDGIEIVELIPVYRRK